jgi:hypothetical protein
MSKPQQPEIARNRRSPADQDSFELKAQETGQPSDQGQGRVPEANRPGHHPEKEQDKPLEPPGTP